ALWTNFADRRRRLVGAGAGTWSGDYGLAYRRSLFLGNGVRVGLDAGDRASGRDACHGHGPQPQAGDPTRAGEHAGGAAAHGFDGVRRLAGRMRSVRLFLTT